MKATFLNVGNLFTVREIDSLKISNDEVLLKVRSCAICGSDLKIAKFGNSRIVENRIIGHEISGVIEDIGKNVKGFQIGDKVSIGADLPCHNCEYCKHGNVNNCSENLAIGYQFDGGFSEYIVLNKHVLIDGPIHKFKNATFEQACLAEPLACAINGVRKSLACLSDTNSKKCLIFGGGPMGLMIAEYLSHLSNDEIFFSEPNEFRRNFIRENTLFKIFEINENFREFDLIFTACPVKETHITALDLVKKSGVINFFGGLPKDAGGLMLDTNLVHYNEIVLTGSHGSTPRLHKEALELIEKGMINLEYLITNIFNLQDINKAFELAFSGNAQKIILRP